LDVSSISLIDNHCHPFLPEREPKIDFSKFFTISTVPEVKTIDIENTIIYRRMIKELKRILNIENEIKLIEKRMKEYHTTPREYISKLFTDANIDTLIIDLGYPAKEYHGYSISAKEFSNLVPCKVKTNYRIEPLIYDLFMKNIPFEDFINEYTYSVERAVTKEKYVSVKTVMSYRFGINTQKRNEKEVNKIYEKMRETNELLIPFAKKTNSMVEKEKVIREYLLFKTLELCNKFDIPFQIHTGMGSAPNIDVRSANPLHLINIITDPELNKVKIVLVHSGYPYVEEAGYLANQYPNVYIDISEMNPFISIGVKNKILSLLEMAPTTKIMYGSDGFYTPEVYWIAAIIAREALSQALDQLIKRKFIDEDYGYKSAKFILHDNAKKLYNV
jgi:predicted TIM-barrel fold metal-dependent hydrolase